MRLARSRNVLGRDTDRFPLIFTAPLNLTSENFGFREFGLRLVPHLPSPAATSVCATGAREVEARAKARLVDSSPSNPIFRSFEPTQRPSAPSARLAFRDQRAILVRWSPASTAGSTMSTM